MTDIRGGEDLERQREDHVKAEAETGVVLLQTKEHEELDPPLESLEGAGPCQQLDFEL